MSIVKFKSKWVEKCVRRVLNKPEGELESEEIFKIKYAKAGGDFSGSVVLELSTELPPEPFVAADGGDEWAVCLHSETTLGEKYNLKDYIDVNSEFNDFGIDHHKTEEWDYAYSEEAEEKWEKFEKSIVKNNIFKDYTKEELNNMGEEMDFMDLLPMEDLGLFSGLIVLRIYEAEVESAAWFRVFSELKVLELAEVTARVKQGGAGEFSRLKQVTFWMD